MSKSTQTTERGQRENVPAGSQTMVLAHCLDMEIDNLIHIHPDNCECCFCYDSWHYQYFLQDFIELLNGVCPGTVELWPVVSSVQILLEQELGHSCEPGSPLAYWIHLEDDEMREAVHGKKRPTYPPGPKKMVVLLLALDKSLRDDMPACQCENYCQFCRARESLRYLSILTENFLGNELSFYGKEKEDLAKEVTHLLANADAELYQPAETPLMVG